MLLDVQATQEQLLHHLKLFVKTHQDQTGLALVQLFLFHQVPFTHTQRLLALLQSAIKKSPAHPPIREVFPPTENVSSDE